MTIKSVNNYIWKKVKPYSTSILFLVSDYIIIALTGQICISMYDISINNSYIYLWIPLMFAIFLIQNDAYVIMRPFICTVRNIFFAVTYGELACVMAIFFFTDWLAARSFFISFWFLLLILLWLERLIISYCLKRGHYLYEKVIIVGAGRTAERTLHFFNDDLGYRCQVVGIIDDNPLSARLVNEYCILGKINDVERIVKTHNCKTVIITAPGMKIHKLQQLINTVQPLVRHLSYVPDLIGTPMSGVEAQPLFSEEILMLKMKNNLSIRRNRIYKRIFDLVLTIVGGLIISPVLLLLALYIKLDSKGDIFYNAERHDFSCQFMRKKFSRYCFGVSPVCLRKQAIKWL